MAKKNDTENPQAPQNGGVEDGFIEVQDHMPLYKPEECENAPVQGYLMGTQPMSPAKGTNNQPWTALVVKLTRETVAVDTDGDVKPVPAGKQILVGGVDNASLYDLANNPNEAREVILRPREGALKLDGGRRMFLFDKQVSKVAYDRAKHGLQFIGRSTLALPAKMDDARNTRSSAGGPPIEPPFGSPRAAS